MGRVGDPCLNGTDCASGECDGTQAIPFGDDAGTCDFDAALGDANPDNCKWYTARGGTCR
jgi:hypothetical protein